MNIDFEKNGYLVVRNFFSEEIINVLSMYFDLKYRIIKSDKTLRQEKTALVSDVADGLCLAKDNLPESILMLYKDKMSQVLGLNLAPTYTYTRIYEQGNTLIPHVDRASCEISATCPITISDSSVSTIFISNFKFDPSIHSDSYWNSGEIKKLGDYTQVDLQPGDALFYKGCEHFHWREPLEKDYLIQFFMHAVRSDGQYSDLIYDGRLYMGF